MVTTECVIEKGELNWFLKVLIGKGMKKKYFKWIVGIMSENLLGM